MYLFILIRVLEEMVFTSSLVYVLDAGMADRGNRESGSGDACTEVVLSRGKLLLVACCLLPVVCCLLCVVCCVLRVVCCVLPA